MLLGSAPVGALAVGAAPQVVPGPPTPPIPPVPTPEQEGPPPIVYWGQMQNFGAEPDMLPANPVLQDGEG